MNEQFFGILTAFPNFKRFGWQTPSLLDNAHHKCTASVESFHETYCSLKRESGKCAILWIQISRYKAIQEHLADLYKNSIDILSPYPCIFTEEFVKRRKKEEKKFLKPLETLLQECVVFANSFSALLIKESQFQVRQEVIKLKRALDEKEEICNELNKKLKSVLDEWFSFLKIEELNSDQAKITTLQEKLSVRLVETVNDVKRRRNQMNLHVKVARALIASMKFCTISHRPPVSEEELKSEKSQALKNLIILEDINGAIQEPGLYELVNFAKVAIVNFFQGSVEEKAELEALGLDNKPPKTGFGLKKLGPFSTLRLSEAEKNQLIFTPIEHYQNIFKYQTATEIHAGVTSPVSKVTITDPNQRSKMKIPLEAKLFCFVYPLISEFKNKPQEEYTPLDALRQIGGYAYFTEDRKLLHVNGLTSHLNADDNIHYSGPSLLQQWSSFAVIDSFKDRFRDVTLPELRDAGALKFAWFMPNELGFSDDGCFVYYYPDGSYNYFKVESLQAVNALSAVRNADDHNTKLRNFDQLISCIENDLGNSLMRSSNEIEH